MLFRWPEVPEIACDKYILPISTPDYSRPTARLSNTQFGVKLSDFWEPLGEKCGMDQIFISMSISDPFRFSLVLWVAKNQPYNIPFAEDSYW